MISLGQVAIFWSVQSHSMNVTGSTNNKSMQDQTIARRLLTVVMSNFLCWFPIGECNDIV